MSSVAKLYDNLFSLNSKRKTDSVYPIHKSLTYEDKQINSIYSFLISEFDLPQNGRLLDCGCGVGYGTLLLADQYPNLKVSGVSLSEKEIALAKEQCNKRNLENRCEFIVGSFDELSPDSYDCIIAIESLKHSPNIEKTMQVISKALRPGGKLIIVEDVGKKSVDNFATRRQCSDWELQKVFSVADYHDVEGLQNKKVRNMTKHMKNRNVLSVLSRVLFAEILVGLDYLKIKKNKGATIIRGGFYQELLYATGKIDYLILTANKIS